MAEKEDRGWEVVRRYPMGGEQVMASNLTRQEASRRLDNGSRTVSGSGQLFMRKRG